MAFAAIAELTFLTATSFVRIAALQFQEKMNRLALPNRITKTQIRTADLPVPTHHRIIR